MAIYCKICGKELDVFSGGRCRKCRQLVCRQCTASGGASNAQGLLCRNCEDAEAAMNGMPPPPGGERWTLPHPPGWLWIALPAVIVLCLTVAVGVPWIVAQRHLRTLCEGEPAESAAAAEELGKIGSLYVVRQLETIATANAEPARTRAIRALGKIPRTAARQSILTVREAAATPAGLHSIIVEALREQELRGWRPEADNTDNSKENN